MPELQRLSQFVERGLQLLCFMAPEKEKTSGKRPAENVTTEEIMQGGGTRDTSTPGEGILTSIGNDRDTSTD